MTDCQKCILEYLSTKDITCNMAGHRLGVNKLLQKSSSYCSNLCFAGSSVLRSLERLGLAFQYKMKDTDGYIRRWYGISSAGKQAIEKLGKFEEK